MSEKDKKNIPEVRFDGFDEEWEKKKLSDVSAIKKGEQLNKENMVVDGQYPVMNGGIEPSGMTDKPNTPKETISISEGGNSCGYVKLNHTEFWSGGHNYTVNKPTMNNDFLYQSLKSQQDRIMNLREGTSLPNIQKGKIENIDVQDTSLEEQKKIAEFFKQLDKLIELNEKKVEKLEALKKSLLKKMFPIGGATTPKIRFDGFSDEWKIDVIKNLFSLVKDGTHATHKDVLEGPLLLSAKNIKNGNITWDESDRHISDEDFNSIYSTYKIQNNDILLTIVGSIGESAIFNQTENIAFQRSVAIMRVNNKTISQFIYSEMHTPKFQNELDSKKTTSAQSGVYLNELNNVYIDFPDNTQEQMQIGKLFIAIEKIVLQYNQKVEKLRNLKISFLNKMIPHTHTTVTPAIRFKEFTGEWKCVEFGKLLQYERPERYIVQNDNYDNKTLVPVLTANKSLYLGFTDETDNVYDKGDVIIFDDFTCDNKFINFQFKVKSSAMKMLTSQGDGNLYFYYLLLQTLNYIPTAHQRHWISVLSKEKVFIP